MNPVNKPSFSGRSREEKQKIRKQVIIIKMNKEARKMDAVPAGRQENALLQTKTL